MKTLVLEGKEFVKAQEAAKEYGYTSDYIGQLCRSGKIDAQLVGRTWYVTLESLYKHKKSRYRSSQKKTKEKVKEEIAARQTTESQQTSPSFYSRLKNNVSISYSQDVDELIPTPKKITVLSEEVAEEEVKSLDVSEDSTPESDYFVDTIHTEKIKSGVLTIVEDTSDVQDFSYPEEEHTVAVEVVRTTTKPSIAPKEFSVSSRFERGSVKEHVVPKTFGSASDEPIKFEVRRSASVNMVAPLSLSLLAGLAVAMLLIGLSWQFESKEGDYSESYTVNMSALIYR